MIEIGELSEYEVAAILRALRQEVVCINSDEREMVKSLCAKLEDAGPTLDTVRRMRGKQGASRLTKAHGMRV